MRVGITVLALKHKSRLFQGHAKGDSAFIDTPHLLIQDCAHYACVSMSIVTTGYTCQTYQRSAKSIITYRYFLSYKKLYMYYGSNNRQAVDSQEGSLYL